MTEPILILCSNARRLAAQRESVEPPLTGQLAASRLTNATFANSSVGLEVAGGARKHGEMHAPPENEAQLAVEIDRRTVRIEHMQERSFRPRCDGSRKRTYKFSREPLSSAGGVDAHGADIVLPGLGYTICLKCEAASTIR